MLIITWQYMLKKIVLISDLLFLCYIYEQNYISSIFDMPLYE